MQFQIPKQTDESLIRALHEIVSELKDLRPLSIRVRPFAFGAGDIDLPDENPEQAEPIRYIIDLGSKIMPNFYIRDKAVNQIPLIINRIDGPVDNVIVVNDQNWLNQLPEAIRTRAAVNLCASARKHLRAIDSETALTGGSDTGWTEYRDSQAAILNSLEQTQKTIIHDFAKKITEVESDNQKRLQQKEEQLEAEYNERKKLLDEEHSARSTDLDAKLDALEAREKSFNTKEARFVARQEQKNQIEQIQGWLEEWSLTKGTRSKRGIVAASYLIGIVVSAGLAGWLTYQNIEILKAAESDLSSIQWWQWILLSLRSLVPLAGFLTFVTYFIRWTSAWARQHAEEEFRNRARILDIGRTAWLLEAVRDAQDHQQNLPPELLRELSRNLFTYNSPLDAGDIDPQSFSDVVLHGLSSLRLKTPDGTELEAKRRRF